MDRIASFVRLAVIVGLLAGLVTAQKLAHEKYTLGNGLTVILHVDHTLPDVSVNLWYRVGARNEPPGRSGFAHLFEHLMFMGTRRAPGNEFDVIMETGGGWNNASTNLDRTNYYSSGPSELLPTLLWLDADRLEDMGHTMTAEKLDRQRDIVRNEIRQNVENTPYGRAYEESFKLLFPAIHPYHKGVYGTHQDLESATVEDVRDFFSSFYVPSNCSLCVAGDFDPETIKPLIAQLFGTLPRGAVPQPVHAEPPKLDGVVRRTMLDRVEQPKLAMAWNSPAAFTDGDAEMMLIGQILTEGKNSRLYTRLVEREQLAVSVSAAQEGSRLGSIFRLSVLTKPEADPAKVEAIVDEEINQLILTGPTPEELAQRQATAELELLTSLQDIAARSDKLNEYEFYWSTPDGLQRDLDRFRKATTDGVKTLARRVLDPSARIIIRVLPQEPDSRPSARDSRPVTAASKPFTPPAPESFRLSNGIPVQLWTMPELPIVTASLVVTADQSRWPLDAPGEAGASGMMASMLTEGAGNLDSAAFSAAWQQIGATCRTYAGREHAEVGVSVLARNFARATELWADAVRRPWFKNEDWERVKAIHLQEIEQAQDEPATVANRVADRLLYGDASPWAWPLAGTAATAERIGLEHVKTKHARLFQPGNAMIFVCGSLGAEDLKPLLEKAFGEWKAPATTVATASAAVTVAGPGPGLRVYVVDRPGAVQTVIHLQTPGVPFAHENRIPLRLISVILGGTFTSRLNQNLREQHGYSYGAQSAFEFGPIVGDFFAGAAVKADVTGAALKEILDELRKLRSGDITPTEFTKARRAYRTETVQGLATMDGRISFATALYRLGGTWADLATDLTKAETLDVAKLNALAKDGIPLERGVLVLVGDQKLILDQIKPLGLSVPVELDPEGTPVDK